MDGFNKLKENLRKELMSWENHTEWDLQSLQAFKAAASALDHLCNIIKIEEEEGDSYSRRYMGDGYSRSRDSRGRFMDSGNGHARSYHGDYGHDQSQEVEELKRKLNELEHIMRR